MGQRREQERQEAVSLARLRREQELAARAAAARRRHTAWEDSTDDTDGEDEYSEREFRVVRGRDGRLYYAKNPSYRPQKQKISDDDELELVRGPDGRLYAVRKTENEPSHLDGPAMDTDDEDRMDAENIEPSQPVKKHTTKSKSSVSKQKNKKKSKRRGFKNMLWNSLRRTESIDEMDTDDEHVVIKEVVKDIADDSDRTDTDDEDDGSSANNNTNVVFQKPPEKKKSKRKRVTIIVEDASDSECEDDDYNSPWRNRRPSPGQWMEPVESYYG